MVLDLDDTLLDHRGSTRRARAGWLGDVGVGVGRALERAWFEVEDRHFDAWRAGLIGFEEQRRRRLRDFLPLLGRAVGTDDELDAVFGGYLGWYERSWQAFADVRPALAALRARGFVLAVLTNGRADQQRAKVRTIGVEEAVSLVLTSEEVGAAKPAPEAFLEACRRLDVEPERVVHVGDRHDLDVVAARAAGLRALHLDRAGLHVEPPEGRVSSLAELPARLGA